MHITRVWYQYTLSQNPNNKTSLEKKNQAGTKVWVGINQELETRIIKHGIDKLSRTWSMEPVTNNMDSEQRSDQDRVRERGAYTQDTRWHQWDWWQRHRGECDHNWLNHTADTAGGTGTDRRHSGTDRRPLFYTVLEKLEPISNVTSLAFLHSGLLNFSIVEMDKWAGDKTVQFSLLRVLPPPR